MVADRRENPDVPQDPNRFCYTDGQRQDIAAKLLLSDEEATSAIDRIEMIVSLTRDSLNYRKEHPVPDWLHAKFRGLDKPIKEILSVIERPESNHLSDNAPNFRGDLKFLLRMVEGDARPSGAPPKPGKNDLIWMVTDLARIWAERHGWPKRWGGAGGRRDQGKFHRFLNTCLTPAAIDVTDRLIREVIENGSITGHPESP